MSEHDDFLLEAEDEPLVPEDGCGGNDPDVFYDEDGTLTLANPFGPVTATPVAELPRLTFSRPCSLGTLNGSWLLTLTPDGPHLFSQIRGPMRIETGGPRIRVSGDVYVRSFVFEFPRLNPIAVEPFVPGSLVIRRNWYPAFPQNQYRWYFRSAGVAYSKGELTFKFVRHLWDTRTEEFVSTDTGWMKFSCSTSIIRPIGAPQPTIEMTGKAMIGGQSYTVKATKTSPYYRGCLVEVDVMKNRAWPATASNCAGTQNFSFTGVYRSAGLDFRVVVNEVDIPEDNLLTTAELHNLLATHRTLSAGGDNWRLWLLSGSRMDGTLGIMFDTGMPPHREGAVGFHDPTLPNISIIEASARGKKLGEVPLAFLRTFIHEAGHAFNLFHPKHDVHGIPVSTTIMNQTGDVMGFATAANPYPCNATFAFNDHNRTSLIHSPDPQVKPGWKEFGWGHGSAFSGVPEPVDAIGLDAGAPEADDLRLGVELPSEAVLGEVLTAKLTVTNIGVAPRLVTTALNLAEGDLKLHLTPPDGKVQDVRDVVVACADRRLMELQPGEDLTGVVQLHYTNQGFTFDQTGRYTLEFELHTGDARGSIAYSDKAEIVIRAAATAKENKLQELTLDQGVGMSLALGDFGADKSAEKKLGAAMDQFGDTQSGAACAMVLANSWGRDFRDVRANKVVRKADSKASDQALDKAFQNRDAASVASLAASVVSPREVDAPLLDQVMSRIKKAKKGAYKAQDVQQADKILQDHLS